MKKKNKIKGFALMLLLCLAVIFTTAVGFLLYFGGFGTGESADSEELKRYVGHIEDIQIPSNTKVVALGEATHGNAEFQQLKLDVFKLMVERYDVRAFVLEADYGCCERANRYINGAAGTALDAASALGFPIYRTRQMAELIDYMRSYNETVKAGDELRFYGNDMQLCADNCHYLAEACERYGIDSTELLSLCNDKLWSDSYGHDSRVRIIDDIRAELAKRSADESELHFADILLQNLCLGELEDGPYQAVIEQRARYMAENVLWVLSQEEALGHGRIFVSAHNGHVARYESLTDMGSLLYGELGDDYYVIGTGYYKTSCNLPVKEPSGKRTVHTVYSHDPIGNAGKKAGLKSFFLDFEAIPNTSSLVHYVSDYHYMGSLGEGFSVLNRLLPMSTRDFQIPSVLYNSMIYVTEPSPTVIESKLT